MSSPSRARVSFQPIRETLDELARLSADWDSYGAAPPTTVAISTAHGLLTNVAERYVEPTDEDALPWVTTPLANGGVQFEWRGSGGAIEVEIGPDGALAYLVERDEQTVARSSPPTPARIGDILVHLASVLDR